jgi:parvulin-like peptidyl-prolyl isomerase
LAVFLVVLGLTGGLRAAETVVDAVVAEVGDRVITIQDVLATARAPLADLKGHYTGDELQRRTSELLADVLRNLIAQDLLVQEAERQLTEQEKQQVQLTVDRIVKEMIGAAGSLVNLRQQLDQIGLTLEQEKRQQTETELMRTLLDKEVRQLVQVRAEEIRQDYREHQKDYYQPKQVRIRQILIRYDDYASKEEARKVGEQVLAKLRDGADFAHLAETYSHGPYAREGGLWEFVGPGVFIEPVDRAAFSLAPGELSDLIEGPTGFHIIRVEEVKPERTVPFEEAQAEISKKLYSEHYQERYRDYMENLQQRARIRINHQYLQSAVEQALPRPPAAAQTGAPTLTP